jgi:uncharacterized protein (TIGR03083 family)
MSRRRWAQVEAGRIALAGRVLALSPPEWDRPSRCQAWRVRDVLGHLVHLAETPLRTRVREQSGRDPARELGGRPVPGLCHRLREAASSRPTGMASVALSEVITHGDDMLRPLGQAMTVPPDVAVAVLRQLRRVDRLAARWAFGGRLHGGVTLIATDVDWTSGRGPHVQGQALDLVALLTNRRGAIDALTGPGVPRLPEYGQRDSRPPVPPAG